MDINKPKFNIHVIGNKDKYSSKLSTDYIFNLNNASINEGDYVIYNNFDNSLLYNKKKNVNYIVYSNNDAIINLCTLHNINYITGPDLISALKSINVPSNINHYKSKNTCKYPINLNAYHRDLYIKIRMAHYIWLFLMIISLLTPYKQIAITIWGLTIILNIFIGKGDCFWNYIEYRISNCNDYGLIQEIGIPRPYGGICVKILYLCGLLVIFYRCKK